MKDSWDWFRPGHSGQRKIHTALPRTCRRVYLETYWLPLQGTKIFYNARGPRWCPRCPAEYVSGLAPGAARNIRNLQISPQMWFLERDLMDLVTGIFSARPRRAGHQLVPVTDPHAPLWAGPSSTGGFPCCGGYTVTIAIRTHLVTFKGVTRKARSTSRPGRRTWTSCARQTSRCRRPAGAACPTTIPSTVMPARFSATFKAGRLSATNAQRSRG